MYTTLIDTETLQEHLEHPDWVIVDCRFSLADTEQGWRDYHASHIPNTIYAHLDEDLSATIIPGTTGRHPLPDADTAGYAFSQWGIDDRVQVVAYDDATGGIAARLWWMLRWLGHDAVAVLDGGWARWQQEELSVTKVIPQPAPRTFVPQVRSDMISDVDEVQSARNDGTCLVVDARAAARYRGEVEPIDPVAGHIPGAVCAPYEENVGADGRMLAPSELRDRFKDLLGDIDVSQVICYCGSGVSACHNLLAMAHADLDGAKLYPGSWSEWITDPARPIATTAT